MSSTYPYDHKGENLQQQYPSESTMLHQFAAKNKKNPGEGDQVPPNLRLASLNAKYQFKKYFTGGSITLFQKYITDPKFDTPPPKIPGPRPAEHEERGVCPHQLRLHSSPWIVSVSCI